MKKAIIFGLGDFAEVAFVYLRDDSPFEVVAFTVDRQFADSGNAMGVPTIAFEELPDHYPPGDTAMFLGIGFSKVNAARTSVYRRCKTAGYALPSYVSSRAARSAETSIGEACFIFEDNVIQPFVTIGDNCVLWSGNHIGHHSRIGSNVFVASHAVVSGRCSIGDNCFLGVNATLRDGVTVGANAVVGAGALVLHDVPEGAVLKGSETPLYERRSDELKKF